MTHCYNCGHAGTFVLLVQFALAVPGPDARVPRGDPDHDGRGSPDRADAVRRRWPHCGDGSRRRDGSRHGNGSRRDARRGTDSPRETSSRRGNDSHHGTDPRRDGFDRDGRLEPGDLPTGGDLSLAVQCPACDSTDVGVAAADLLARYGSNTTS